MGMGSAGGGGGGRGVVGGPLARLSGSSCRRGARLHPAGRGRLAAEREGRERPEPGAIDHNSVTNTSRAPGRRPGAAHSAWTLTQRRRDGRQARGRLEWRPGL